MSKMISPLQQVRSEYAPKLPPSLRFGAAVKVEKGAPLAAFADAEKIATLFPSTSNMPDLKFSAGGAGDIIRRRFRLFWNVQIRLEQLL